MGFFCTLQKPAKFCHPGSTFIFHVRVCCETAVVLTVPDFPACRPLIELRAPAKLLLYSTNKAVSTTTRMSLLCTYSPPVVACIGKSNSWPHLPHRCPSPTPSFSEDECSFTQSAGQSCLGRRVCRRARKSGRRDCCHISQILLSLSSYSPSLHLQRLWCQLLLPMMDLLEAFKTFFVAMF